MPTPPELMPTALDYAKRIAATASLPSRALKRFVAAAMPKGLVARCDVEN